MVPARSDEADGSDLLISAPTFADASVGSYGTPLTETIRPERSGSQRRVLSCGTTFVAPVLPLMSSPHVADLTTRSGSAGPGVALSVACAVSSVSAVPSPAAKSRGAGEPATAAPWGTRTATATTTAAAAITMPEAHPRARLR